MSNVTAIVLAAGLSSRMGKFKLGLPFNQHTILDEVLTTISATEVMEIILVSGHYRSETENIGRSYPKVRLAHNPDYQQGMSSSIQAGLKLADPTANGIMICLSDMPFIPSSVFQNLLDAHKQNKDTAQIFRPAFAGKPGHPVLFTQHYREALRQLTYHEGARQLIKQHRDSVKLIPVDTEAIFRDIDTESQYQKFVEGI